jgi:hypothetical protein
MWLWVSIAGLLVSVAVAEGRPDPGSCDRTGDNRVTVVDALQALQDSVNVCVRGYECDVDGDYYESAVDALALLRYAVGMPQELSCSCIVFDECFGDDDCKHRGPEWICDYYLCAQCDNSHPCPEGQFCDTCSLQCQPIE